mmetsp:Transcript_12941/g.22107  ORF Transcript_12941/g.22107 Transcript_12941/m.22107 type:complete len:306 (+) Transcript_12941:65-982(+)
MKLLTQCYLGIASISSFTAGFSAPSASSVQSLLSANQEKIASLKTIAQSISSDAAVSPTNDVFYLRYALETSYENDDERTEALKSNIQWRLTDGKDIVTSAHQAMQAASSDSKWDNQPVQQAAPHADRINKYLTSVQCITTSHPTSNDLIYCVRAGKIDDKALMSSVSVDEMIDFFLYVKEVNAAVADMRSLETDSLIKVVTCNDLLGVKLVGGSKDFRSALSLSSKKATQLFPSLSGRTLLLNPPKLLSALIKVFSPLFPKVVMDRIRFERGPLKDTEDLLEIVNGGAGREEFIQQMDELVYSD